MVNLLGIQKKKKVNSRNEIHMLHARSWKKKEKQMNMHLMKIECPQPSKHSESRIDNPYLKHDLSRSELEYSHPIFIVNLLFLRPNLSSYLAWTFSSNGDLYSRVLPCWQSSKITRASICQSKSTDLASPSGEQCGDWKKRGSCGSWHMHI